MGCSTGAARGRESDLDIPHRWQGFCEQVFFLLKRVAEILHAPQTCGRTFLIVTLN